MKNPAHFGKKEKSKKKFCMKFNNYNFLNNNL